MKVLLDECVPKALRQMLVEFDTRTARQMRWDAMENGQLLVLAEKHDFTVFITSDKKLRYQQNLAGRRIAVIELPTNRISVLRSLGQAVVAALRRIRPGEYIAIRDDKSKKK